MSKVQHHTFGKKRKVKHTEDEVQDELTRLQEIVFRKAVQKDDQEVVDGSYDVDEKKDDPTPEKKIRAPAWEDEEDMLLTVDDVVSNGTENPSLRRKSSLPLTSKTDRYDKMLAENFRAIVGTPKWAKLKESTGEEEEFGSKVLRNASQLLGSSSTLSATMLNYTRLNDMNEKGIVQKTIITSIEFNPTAQVSAVANRSGNVTFYQVDGDKNSLLHKIAFQRFPIDSAKFSPDGSEFLVGSSYRASFQSLDLASNKASMIPAPLSGPEFNNTELFCLSNNGEYIALAGKDGSVAILTSHTKELIHTLKVPCKCVSLSFSSDSSMLFTYSVDGKVYIWEVNQRKCLHRFVDEGCLRGVSMSLAPGDQYLALGSSSGIVNVYSQSSFMPTGEEISMYPQPLKAITNLTTEASCVQFNSSAQILAIASKMKDSSIKLVHLPTLTVFKNFPIVNMALGRVGSINFSPNSGYIAIGTNIGTAKLIRLNHFSNY
ncbi:Hypothetical predicted protein [Cloeon dipterum]|uniref:U3 small nucleolar RNA-associated protein 18 homolog n=2 Tax=Cloeon dipterum TaxID=197152 RepID=A0A8S1CN90_9INSE|nr:Hypothetical predicted protein [Cloeon dipterum]